MAVFQRFLGIFFQAGLLSIILSGALMGLARGEDFSPRYEFYMGNSYYKEAKFDEAIRRYETILQHGYENGVLYYNLGNCYFKKQELGEALLNYERAMLFIPGDSDLRANYDYTKNMLNLGRHDFFATPFDRLFAGITVDEITIFLTAVYATIFLVLILGMFFRRQMGKLYVPLLGFLIVMFSLCVAALGRKIYYFDRAALVVVKTTEVKFEPFENATTFFTLEEGRPVEVLESSGSWYKVRRADGKTGWVAKDAIEFIRLRLHA